MLNAVKVTKQKNNQQDKLSSTPQNSSKKFVNTISKNSFIAQTLSDNSISRTDQIKILTMLQHSLTSAIFANRTQYLKKDEVPKIELKKPEKANFFLNVKHPRNTRLDKTFGTVYPHTPVPPKKNQEIVLPLTTVTKNQKFNLQILSKDSKPNPKSSYPINKPKSREANKPTPQYSLTSIVSKKELCVSGMLVATREKYTLPKPNLTLPFQDKIFSACQLISHNESVPRTYYPAKPSNSRSTLSEQHKTYKPECGIMSHNLSKGAIANLMQIDLAPKTEPKFKTTKRLKFNRRSLMANMPLIIINFEGVIGDIQCTAIFSPEPIISYIFRPSILFYFDQ